MGFPSTFAGQENQTVMNELGGTSVVSDPLALLTFLLACPWVP